MTELERARAHLQDCQRLLAGARMWAIGHELIRRENMVLAALSWVWEEQQIHEADCEEWWGNRSEYA